MSRASASGAGRAKPKLAARARQAALWKTPRSAVLLIVSVEALCVTWLFAANVFGRPALSDLGRFFLLFAVALLYAEGAQRVELLRRYVAQLTFGNASSLWCMAAALILPVGLAGAFALVLHIHSLLRLRRSSFNRPFQSVFVAASEVIATMAAASVIAYFGADHHHLSTSFLGTVAVLVALVVYPLLQQTLVSSAIYLTTRPIPLREVMLSRDDQVTEFSTLALAVLLAATAVYTPYLAPLVLAVIVVLRRSALVQELEVQATRDAKTGLLNAGAWRQEADQHLVRAERTHSSVSVVMLDLDHFKILNDTYGHPAGDATLRAVADCLTEALRGYDAIGRFGGEEFIALLNDVDEATSRVVAERLCARIRMLVLPHGGDVTASIGVAVGTAGQDTLDDLISLADKALYVAKGSGRDQVYVVSATTEAVSPPVRALRVPLKSPLPR